MACLVVKDNITSGGALAVGQTLRLGGFVMTARLAAAPLMTSRVIKNSLHVNSELAEQTMIGLGLNPTKGILNPHWTPMR